MSKRISAWLLALCILFVSVPACAEMKRFSVLRTDLFDTVTTCVGYAASREAFEAAIQPALEELETWHILTDIYHGYEGISNLKTVNDAAGIAPVKVDSRIIDLLLFCRDMCGATGGAVDVSFGAVLEVWHDYRTEGTELPPVSLLEEASGHTGFDLIEINTEEHTVFITDPEASLDVGAVAKGYAGEQVKKLLPEHTLLSLGGNVVPTGGNPVTDQPWKVGVQDPDGSGSDFLHLLATETDCTVTSGDYQRYYTVNGVRYCHIIDPETLFPPTRWKAVTVICGNSAVADMLSTALFLKDPEAGQLLLDLYGAEALWVSETGEQFMSPGYQAYIR